VTSEVGPSPRSQRSWENRATIIPRHLGHPRGIVGRVTGRMMVRGNECLNEWIVDELADRTRSEMRRIVEVGPGPGVGLSYLLAAFPAAQVCGIDHSGLMVKQARRRNAASVQSGRLTLVQGNVNVIRAFHPVDLVVAVNVLYFWKDPHTELHKVRDALGDKGAVALGYQLRRNLPERAQESFPQAGYRLYDNDEEITTLLQDVGFTRVDSVIRGPHRMQVAFR